MTTVQLTAYGRDGARLFYTIGMGINVAAAKASARVGMRARLTAEPETQRSLRLIEMEEI